jgi:hypothetical protein
MKRVLAAVAVVVVSSCRHDQPPVRDNPLRDDVNSFCRLFADDLDDAAQHYRVLATKLDWENLSPEELNEVEFALSSHGLGESLGVYSARTLGVTRAVSLCIAARATYPFLKDNLHARWTRAYEATMPGGPRDLRAQRLDELASIAREINALPLRD